MVTPALTRRRSVLVQGMAVAVTVATLGASQIYYAFFARNVVYDSSVLVFGVVVPLLVGCLCLYFTDQRVLLLGFFAIFWSVVDDAPVFFDSALTWPRVTGFHPYLPHHVTEVVLHILTFAFLLLSARLALGRSRVSGRRALSAYLLVLLAFVASYAQNIPLVAVEIFVYRSWYQLDVIEHLATVALYGLALWVARGPGLLPPEAPVQQGAKGGGGHSS